MCIKTPIMRACVTILLMVVAAWLSAAPQYHTQRLQQIACKGGFNIPEMLSPSVRIDSIASLRGHTICLRTNGFGDVAHIGYNLFSRELMSHYGRTPLFEFVERYLLELDLELSELGMAKRMDIDRVVMVEGSWDVLRQLTPASNVFVNMEELARHNVRLTFESNGQRTVLTIPSNCQLLLGANAIELEQIALRDIQRMIPLAALDIWGNDWEMLPRTRAENIEIADGGHYIINEIRGDLYFNRIDGKLQLICSTKSPVRSISNLMLTGMSDDILPMKLVLNEYGQRSDTIQIAFQQLIAYFQVEGCKLFFGVKSRNDNILSGTLFAYNQDLAYTHMVSVDVPLTLIDNGEGIIESKAYVYIPIQNIPDKYFEQNFNPITE